MYRMEDAEFDAVLVGASSDIDTSSLSLPADLRNMKSATQFEALLASQRYLDFAADMLDVEIISLSSIVESPEGSQLSSEMKMKMQTSVVEDRPSDDEACQDSWTSSFPFHVASSECGDVHQESLLSTTVGLDETSIPGSIDTSMKQLRRDIQRDKMLINGELITGCSNELDDILDTFRAKLTEIVRECRLPALDSSQGNSSRVSRFLQLVLRRACRTHSGGMAYTAVESALNRAQQQQQRRSQCKNLLAPLSTRAPPLVLRLSVGEHRSLRTDFTIPASTSTTVEAAAEKKTEPSSSHNPAAAPSHTSPSSCSSSSSPLFMRTPTVLFPESTYSALFSRRLGLTDRPKIPQSVNYPTIFRDASIRRNLQSSFQTPEKPTSVGKPSYVSASSQKKLKAVWGILANLQCTTYFQVKEYFDEAAEEECDGRQDLKLTEMEDEGWDEEKKEEEEEYMVMVSPNEDDQSMEEISLLPSRGRGRKSQRQQQEQQSKKKKGDVVIKACYEAEVCLPLDIVGGAVVCGDWAISGGHVTVVLEET